MSLKSKLQDFSQGNDDGQRRIQLNIQRLVASFNS